MALKVGGIDLGQMVGPLPLGAWVGATAGAVGVAYVVRRRQAAAPPRVLTSGEVPYAAPVAMVEPDWRGAFGLSPAPSGPPAGAPIETNVDWQRAATIVLIGRGYQAYTVQQALAKYLQGLDPLTPDELAVVESALRFVGPPPQPPSVAPPPLPPTATVPRSAPSNDYALRTRAWRIGTSVFRYTWPTVAEAQAFRLPAGAVEVPWQTLSAAENAAILANARKVA
ncbi:MAG: hypothetical protein LC798_05280 [Chloroflexi bacterium]|nr:hypothetical protein [Chloroflexota bacterium]